MPRPRATPPTPFQLGVMTPFWMRANLSRVFLDYYNALFASLRPKMEVYHVLAYSPEDPDAEAYDEMVRGVYSAPHTWITTVNRPVSNKWNTAMRHLGGVQSSALRFDAGMCLQSDDFLNADFFLEAARLIRAGYDLVKPGALYFFDTYTGKACFVPVRHIGACNVFSELVLRRCRWEPWAPGLDRGIDSMMDRRLRGGAVRRKATITMPPYPKTGPAMLDVKIRAEREEGTLTSENIHSYESMRSALRRAVDVDASEVLPRVFPGLTDRLFAL